MKSLTLLPLATCAGLLACPSAFAQIGGGFQTPGQPVRAQSGQTDRFSNEFNPAIGGVLDTWLRWIDNDAAGADDGLTIELRSAEFTVNTWIDPNTWAWAVLVGEPEEGIEVEEAAAVYQGFGGNSTLRAGRFFVDFGKQMQAHVHDLPTFERPAVLRAYLGDELGGTGVQYDNWFASGDSGAIRYSIGVFDSLAAGHGHGDEEEEEGAAITTAELKEIDELSLTARLTGFHDVGDNGVFQWGVSARALPEFAFDADLEDGTELTSEGNSNHIFGVDLTYGTTSDSGTSGWTFGGEFLMYDGDIAAEVDDNGTPANFADDFLTVVDDDRSGFYVWADHKMSERNSLGVLYSEFEHTEAEAPSESEIVLYYSRNLTEFSRLRFGVSLNDPDEGDESTAFLVQFTNFFGSHAHGVNW